MKLSNIISTIIIIFICNNTIASSALHLESANNNINDIKSLQNGASLFMNYCSGCHSLSFMRYNRLAKDLKISDKRLKETLMLNTNKVGDLIVSSMQKNDANKWFGAVPPDLSLIARAKGVDWIYTYLNSFYLDKKRLFGVNNKILENVSMPDILWKLKADLPKKEFEKQIRDITNFLDYVSEPAQLIRKSIGWKVLIFLSILLILSILLKREYWRDVKYGKWKIKN